MRKILLLAAAAFLSMQVSAYAFINKSVQIVLPKTQITNTFKTQVKGLYGAVMANGQILYVFPKQKLILFGQLWTNTGKNLTQAAMVKMQQSKAEAIVSGVNLKKAIKIGNGSVKVIEFMNIDCPFCRLAEKFFSKPKFAKRVTRYVFLIPQPSIHPNSANMELYYLTKALGKSNEHKAKLLNEIMIKHIYQTKTGNIVPKFKASKKAVARLSYDTALAKKYSIFGVPMFVINGKVIEGINVGAILNAIGFKGINISKLNHSLFRR